MKRENKKTNSELKKCKFCKVEVEFEDDIDDRGACQDCHMDESEFENEMAFGEAYYE